MINKKYSLKQKDLRKKINLQTEPFNSSITSAVRTVSPNVNITVNKDNFVLSAKNEKDFRPRLMGKAIVNNCPNLKALVKEYYYNYSDGSTGRSGQLFFRIN